MNGIQIILVINIQEISTNKNHIVSQNSLQYCSFLKIPCLYIFIVVSFQLLKYLLK